MASKLLRHAPMASRFESRSQQLAIVSTAAAALLAALASSPPSCPMSVSGGDTSALSTDRPSYERHFAVESSERAVGVISVFLESSSAGRVLVQVIPDRVPDGEAMGTAAPVAVELAPGVRQELEFPSFLEGVRVLAELENGGEVFLEVMAGAAQDDCSENAFVKVVDG